MIPTVVLDRVQTPMGELRLARRGDEFSIRVAGVELMNSRNHASEDEFGRLAGALVAGVATPRVLIGGLGMGFTLRAALDALGDRARVDVVELVPAVVRWNRELYGHLAGAPLGDSRVHVIEADVVAVVRESTARYDAIVLDVDNGPDGISEANGRLYGARGLAELHAALAPGGALAIWSAFEAPAFTKRVTKAGFGVEVRRVRTQHGGNPVHFFWVARRRG
ncbi:MAG TPA: hypothetical protein VFQ53_08840 [Kofleriaceae bacterium]|nr:hypothetical protein [Kofleriaceae bacterium]